MTEPAPEVTPAQALAAYVGASETDPFVPDCAAQAAVLVATYITGFTVPDEIVRRAQLEVGSELYHRKNAPNGIAQFADGMGNAVRVARDPMLGAYPLLNRYVVTGL